MDSQLATGRIKRQETDGESTGDFQTKRRLERAVLVLSDGIFLNRHGH